jgi:hypothetical protein
MPPDDFADATADNITGNGLNLAVFQFGETAAGFLFPSGFNLWLNVGVQGKRQAIHHFRHLFARQMTRFFDDLIQCHRHDGKLRRNHAGRNGEFSLWFTPIAGAQMAFELFLERFAAAFSY